MRVQKSSSRKPQYPSKRQFMAALGIGALAAAVAQAEPPRLLGAPLPPKAATSNEVRLRGDIAVEPRGTNSPACPTNAISCPVPSTNAVPRVPGEPASPK